jgi:hypothetical protein
MTEVRVKKDGYGHKVFLKTDDVEIEINKVIDFDIEGISVSDQPKVTISFYPSSVIIY